MKISNSKKQLAEIIHENGGWRDGAEWAALEQQGGDVWLCALKPLWNAGIGIFSFKDHVKTIPGSYKLPNIHQTILSRDEYFHLYPVKVEVVVENKTACHLTVTDKPTIEQLAADYRNRKDFADRKQQEADAAKADAEAKLAELVAAGKALGLVLSVAGVEPELVITDWRDLQVGDEVEAKCHGGVLTGFITEMEPKDYDGERPFRFQPAGYSPRWCTSPVFSFIRRPARGDANA